MTTKAKPGFTPGPWKYGRNLGCKSIKGGKRGTSKQAQYAEIADTVGLYSEAEDEANARLIAQAPAMYEALARLTDVLCNRVTTRLAKQRREDEIQAAWESARAVIAAVEGEK